jgi:hypothetical protein
MDECEKLVDDGLSDMIYCKVRETQADSHLYDDKTRLHFTDFP